MFRIIFGDITEVEADVIVNAANTELKHGGGVARAIALKAGKELVEESKKIGFCEIGEVAVTTAGNLKAKKVFHVPTICYKTGRKASLKDIEKAFEKVCELALKFGYKKVATPLLGAGVVGLDEKEVEKVIKKVAEKFEELEIILVKYKKDYRNPT